MAQQKQQKSTLIFLTPVFLFFATLLLVVSNLRYSAALDKELEVRVLGVSLFMLIILAVSVFNKKNRLNTIDVGLLKNPFVWLYFLFILMNALSIVVAYNTGEALHETLKLLTYFILFLYIILYVLPKENSRELFLKAMILFSLLISLIGIYQALTIFPEHGFSVKSAYLIKGNFAHKNIFSELLLLAFTFSLYASYLFRKNWQKAALIGAFINLILILLLVTRAVWMALFVATLISLAVYRIVIYKKGNAYKLPKSLRLALGGLMLTGLLVFVGALTLDSKESLKKHIIEATDFSSGNTYHRLNMWKKSIPIVKDNPMLGVGAANWKIEVLKYNTALYSNNGWVVPRRTHNDYINVITETGIVGLAAFLGMFVVLLFYLIKSLKRATERQDQLFLLALFFALTAYMTFSFFNFTKERVETQIILNIIFAFSVFEYHRNKKGLQPALQNNSIVRTVGFAALIPLFFTAYSAGQRLKSEVAVHEMIRFSQAKSPQAARRAYNVIKDARNTFISLSPMNDPLYGLEAVSALRANHDKQEVLKLYKKALQDFPFHVKTITEIAYVYSELEQHDKALEFSNRALEYAPDNRKVLLDHVVYLNRADKEDEAFEFFKNMRAMKNKRYKRMAKVFVGKEITDATKRIKDEIVIAELIRLSQNEDNNFALFEKLRDEDADFEELIFRQVSENLAKKAYTPADSTKNRLLGKELLQQD